MVKERISINIETSAASQPIIWINCHFTSRLINTAYDIVINATKCTAIATADCTNVSAGCAGPSMLRKEFKSKLKNIRYFVKSISSMAKSEKAGEARK